MSRVSTGISGYRLEKLKHSLVELQNLLMFRVLLWKNRKDLCQVGLTRLGSQYGGWWIPIEAEYNYKNRTLVSAGLGFDTSFDELMLRRGWSVLGIDPLTECCEIAKKRLESFPQLEILNCGLSVNDGFQTFFQPKNPNHDSWSTINAQEIVHPISKSFPVISLRSILRDYKIAQQADYRYLKMDIEGAELALLEDSLKEISEFNFLAVELDFLALIPFRRLCLRINRVRKMRLILRELKQSGWKLVHVENSNFFWEAT